MEVQFHKTVLPCIKQVLNQTDTQEQTQEFRIPDSLPDVGNILGVWGQVHVRGKDWRNDSIAVSCGIMTWVLYTPEDGSDPVTVESWIPFQLKWDLPELKSDGVITVHPVLNTMDARVLSARKLMLRASLSTSVCAEVPAELEYFYESGVGPEDIQVCKKVYPMEIPKEAGEKVFSLEEELEFSTNASEVKSILRYSVFPEVSDQRVVNDKFLFRGKINLQILYSTTGGQILLSNPSFGFSQYVQLNGEYHPGADVETIPAITSSELEKVENGYRFKVELAVQYRILDKCVLETIEDAYSPLRDVQLQTAKVDFPTRLDKVVDTDNLCAESQGFLAKVLDAVFYCGCPTGKQMNDRLVFTVPGQFQVLYQDEKGILHSESIRTAGEWICNSDPNNSFQCIAIPSSELQISQGADRVTFSCDVMLNCSIYTEQGMESVSGLTFETEKERDPGRPSLILRRKGKDTLWELAKHAGSTVEMIRQANQLTSDPEDDRLLLIPVL